jgi:hypothetical protein
MLIAKAHDRPLRPDLAFDHQRQFQKQLRASGSKSGRDLVVTVPSKAPF